MRMKERAHSRTVEVAGAGHAIYVSHPKDVADVIESAAREVSKQLGFRKEFSPEKDQVALLEIQSAPPG
jgi:hypothetical protein